MNVVGIDLGRFYVLHVNKLTVSGGWSGCVVVLILTDGNVIFT